MENLVYYEMPLRCSTHRALLCTGALTFLLLHKAVWVEAAFISSSKIQQCTNDGLEPLDCGQKLVLSLSVDANLKPGAEVVNFIESASDERGGDGQNVSFDPIQMSISRSAVTYRYPFFYISEFNGNPYELTLKGSAKDMCDDSFSTKASCGLQYNAQNQPIPYSQGFCCNCGLCSATHICGANARSSIACDLFGALTSASCLRFGDDWYSGYSIGPATLWFTIDLTFTRNTTDGRTESTTLTLTPDSLDAADENFGSVAQIIGTFHPTVEPLYLGDKYLFVPKKREGGQWRDAADYMILPATMVTLDGTQCNKVGVGYYAFNSQGSRCEMESGSCLLNQLTSLRKADDQRVREGKRPLYLSAAYGDVSVSKLPNKDTVELSYVSPAPPSTMITVTIVADDLQYVIAVATGKIVKAEMNMGVVEANSRDAVMMVDLQNTGAIVAEYTISVHNCTGGVYPVPSQRLSIEPNETTHMSFDIYCQEDAQESASCAVTLLNSVKEVADETTVRWEVTPIVRTNSTETMNDGGETKSGGDIKGSCENCNVVNVLCMVEHRCIGRSIGFFGVLALIVLLAVLFFCFRQPLMRLLGVFCCCFPCCHRKHRSSSSKGTESAREPTFDGAAKREPCGKEAVEDWEKERAARVRRTPPTPDSSSDDEVLEAEDRLVVSQRQRLAASLSLSDRRVGAGAVPASHALPALQNSARSDAERTNTSQRSLV